jgi:hypothetical protein
MYVDKIDVGKMSVVQMSVDRMTRCHFIINLSINFWADNIKVFRLKPWPNVIKLRGGVS